MRILVLHNLYPPAHMGGYGIACERVVNALIARGHDVAVITTNHNIAECPPISHVHRCLKPSSWRVMAGRKTLLEREIWNNRIVSRLILEKTPEVVSVWAMSGIGLSILATIYRNNIPVSLYFHDAWFVSALENDTWLSFWARVPKDPFRRAVKGFLKLARIDAFLSHWSPTQFTFNDDRLRENSIFVSRSCREEYARAGYRVQEAGVLYNAIEERYFGPAPNLSDEKIMRVLYVGHIQPTKGLHVLIESMELLEKRGKRDLRLTVVGPVLDQEYYNAILKKIALNGLSDKVQFLGELPPEMVRGQYLSHHVLVFPSIGIERFPLSILEAMACGLVVVTTLTGGHREVLEDETNCLVFSPGDSDALTNQLVRLLNNSGFRSEIAFKGQSFIRNRFRLSDMVDRFEKHLYSVAESE